MSRKGMPLRRRGWTPASHKAWLGEVDMRHSKWSRANPESIGTGYALAALSSLARLRLAALVLLVTLVLTAALVLLVGLHPAALLLVTLVLTAALVLLVGLRPAALVLLIWLHSAALPRLARARIVLLLAGILVGTARIAHYFILHKFSGCPGP